MQRKENSNGYRWTPMLIECYERIISGKGCENCYILPRTLETMPRCTIKKSVLETVKSIGTPVMKEKFLGVEITPATKIALNKARQEIPIYELTKTDKDSMQVLYLIAEANGLQFKSKKRKYIEFIIWLKEKNNEI